MICVRHEQSHPHVAVLALAAAAIGAAVCMPGRAQAGDFDALRGSFLNPSSAPAYLRWDGVNFGAQIGLSSLDTDYGHSLSNEVAFILRNSTLENEFSPQNWTSLPNDVSSGHNYGLFLGYSVQWDELVLGVDATYTRTDNLATASSGSIERIVTTSDSIKHDVTINGQAYSKIIDYATLRARAGYAFGQFLPYAFAGAAVGRLNYATSATVTDVQTIGGVVQAPFIQSGSSGKDGAIVGGFTAGLGIDVALFPNVFLRGEWEFVALGEVNGIRNMINAGRVGVGVKF